MLLDIIATTTETPLNYARRRLDLDEAVLFARQSLELHYPLDPLHSEYLDNLGDALSTRFEDGGQRDDLDAAISLYRQALELRPTPDPLRPNSLNNLSQVLLTRFRNGGQPSDLDEAVSLPKQALELLTPAHPLESLSLHNLALALYRQFEARGKQSDLYESISLHQQAVELRAPPHPRRADSLDGLGSALWTRFNIGGDRIDLETAISLHKQALELRPSPHAHRASSLTNLANDMAIKFQQDGHKSDLDEAIFLHRQALELRHSPHPSRYLSLMNLAAVLGIQFEREVHHGDLDEAISLQRQALGLLPSSHPDRYKPVNNLATALKVRFERKGRRSDLAEAISLHRHTLELVSSTHPHRSMFLSNLATALWVEFGQRGHQRDLDEAILLHRQALELRPSPHPLRFMSLNNLANALVTRFRQEGRQSDLDETIFLQRQALELLPSPHPHRSMSLNNLADALAIRSEHQGRQSDLDEAILLLREALELRTSSHFLRSSSLNNLANALVTRFKQGGRRGDLDETILMNRQALELLPSPHPQRSESLINLANALRTRFEQDGDKTDCNEAISMYREALGLRPSPHPGQSQSLYELGIGLLHAHSLTGDNLNEVMESFSAATQCLNQPASLRLRIAHTWIKHAVSHRHMSAIDAHDAALQALPKLAALSFDVKSRQTALLTESDGLARDASRFAIQGGNTDKAIEFLEAGRAVFWSQFLSLRSPLEQLREIAPELADKLRDTATALELGSHRNTLADTSENQLKLFLDQETARLNRLNEEWSQAIDDVRQLKGFEHFLRPRRISELQAAASEGPVVILIGNEDGSDILILTLGNVRTIHLADLSNPELQNLVHLIHAASSDSFTSRIEKLPGNIDGFSAPMVESLRSWMKLEEERGISRKRLTSSDDIFRSVLKTLWTVVVKPVIEVLDLKKSERPPVVQWCPTGLFSFLPIHAAGLYEDDLEVQCASDFFIPSYTPTIGALLTQDRTPAAESFKMMVVIQSQELAATRKELENIEKHVSSQSLVKLGVPGASASVEAVASRLSDVDIVHFSCHGTQDRLNPLDSGLKLEDGYLRVSRVMKEKIPNGALAFLCACETAMGDGKLPDEAMSLGASLLFSGFRRVVATMWVMRDEDGPVIADTFYEELFRGQEGKPTREPDASKSAYALHMAVKKLRSKRVSFRRWVPFIHMGK